MDNKNTLTTAGVNAKARSDPLDTDHILAPGVVGVRFSQNGQTVELVCTVRYFPMIMSGPGVTHRLLWVPEASTQALLVGSQPQKGSRARTH